MGDDFHQHREGEIVSIKFFEIEKEVAIPERRLWVAVVDLAVKDALAFGRDCQEPAIRWLFRDSEDRAIAFDLAGIDPDWFTKGVAAAIVDQAEVIANRKKSSEAERAAASAFLLSPLCEKMVRLSSGFVTVTETMRAWRKELLAPHARAA
jgi:hypothetical protein